MDRAFDEAEQAYDDIRADTADVGRIARNTGLSVKNIRKVKTHLFHAVHLLDRYLHLGVAAERRRFDADPRVVGLWRMLSDVTTRTTPMQFSKQEDLIRVVRISGPAHNLLGLQFGDHAQAPELEELSAPGRHNLQAADVAREVMAGVDEAAGELGLTLRLQRIQFVASDTGPASVYRDLASAAVRRYASELDTAGPPTRLEPRMQTARIHPDTGAARRKSS